MRACARAQRRSLRVRTCSGALARASSLLAALTECTPGGSQGGDRIRQCGHFVAEPDLPGAPRGRTSTPQRIEGAMV